MSFKRLLTPCALLAAALSSSQPARADSGWGLLNMTTGVTELSHKIYSLHMLIFWICVAIGVVVFGIMIYSITTFTKAKGAVPDTKMVHNTKVEIVWTVVPVLILVAMAVPAARTLIEIEDTRNTDITIKVTGFQWGWQYEYLDHGVSFFSRLDRKADEARQLASGVDPNSIPNYLLAVDKPLVIPNTQKVRLLITAVDVIHAWWLPAFGMKKDAIPGFINEMWIRVDKGTTGMFRGQCVELCGRDHGFMPIVVDVRSPEDFQNWLKTSAQPAGAAAVVAQR